MVRIKFKTEADEARGFYELLTRASGESLQGGVYWVEESALKILDESGIAKEDFDIAKEMIENIGYDRRKPEVEELRKELEKF